MKYLMILCCLSIQAIGCTPKVLVGVAGGTASGKTTLAEKIQDAFEDRSILISQDAYYRDLRHLSYEERAKVNFDHPDSLDFEMLRKHLIALKRGEAIEQPIYNFRTHAREDSVRVIEPAQLVIVEGILLFAVPEVRELFDLKLYVESPDDVRILRRIKRDMLERSRTLEQIEAQYLNTVQPMHNAFVLPSKRYADVIIPTNGYNRAALNMILGSLRSKLSG